jgi:hypothetical protein
MHPALTRKAFSAKGFAALSIPGRPVRHGVREHMERRSVMTHHGSCHCGNVHFEVKGEVTAALACNCSICSRKGALLWATQRESFHLRDPKDQMGRYTFNRHAIAHRFCPVCGIHTHSEDTDLSGTPAVYVNLRCLDDIDLAQVPVHHFDGRSM